MDMQILISAIYAVIIVAGVYSYVQLRINKKKHNELFQKKQPTNNGAIYGPYSRKGKGATKS